MIEKNTHIQILKSVNELPFNIGKKSLMDFLKGDTNNMIEKHNLMELSYYGNMFKFDKKIIEKIIDFLLDKKMLELIRKNHFKIIKITPNGKTEILICEIDLTKIILKDKITDMSNSNFIIDTKITEIDYKNFEKYRTFLKGYNDEQKKAIISYSKNILCIAGAGCGKTTVLTKRIGFYIEKLQVNPKKILAITFTKKAKEEMKLRLNKMGFFNIYVETFNSLCEKILRKYENEYYKKKITIINFSNKIKILKNILLKLNFKIDYLINEYFTTQQKKQKTNEELFFNFTRDIYSIIDIYKISKNNEIPEFFKDGITDSEKIFLKKIYYIVKEVEIKIKEKNFRDFNDQIIHCIDFIEKVRNEKIKINGKNKYNFLKFGYILIDEYQDLNYSQYKFIQLIYKNSIFAVGDPRQTIFGWRGSENKYLYKFKKEFEDVEIITLKKNYRSCQHIIDLSNKIIENMKLVDLESGLNKKNDKSIFLFKKKNENEENEFVYNLILSKKPEETIFVLSRTNRKLEKLSQYLLKKKIRHLVKTENDMGETGEIFKIVLATIHSIKGQESDTTIIIDCNSTSFPNKTKDNSVLSLVKQNIDYNKYNEEVRLFYVALTRAKNKLVLTYTNSLTSFITDEILENFGLGKVKKKVSDFNIGNVDSVLKTSLKNWRGKIAGKLYIPAYCVITNRSIDEICLSFPQTLKDLENINGLGPQKIMKYGNEILQIVSGR